MTTEAGSPAADGAAGNAAGAATTENPGGASATPADPAGTGTGATDGGDAAGSDPSKGAGDSFFAGLGEDSQVFLAGKGMENGSAEDLARAAIEGWQGAEKLIGGKSLPMPDPDKVLEWDGFKQLGVPDDAGGYEITQPKLPEGVPYSEDREAWFKGVAAKARLHPQQVQIIVDELAANETQMHDDFVAARDADEASAKAELQKEFGQGLAAAKERANATLKHYGVDIAGPEGDALAAVLGSAKLIKLLADAGQALSEDGAIDPVQMGAMTPNQAKARREELQNDKGFMERYNGGDKEAMQTMLNLNVIIEEAQKTA